jgi:YD repeat-containing protein
VPVTTSAFGKLQSTLGYDTMSSVASGFRGTLKTVKDGNGNTTTLTNWKRGIPQKVAFPSAVGFPATYKSAVVDDNGWVTSTTDELGSKTCYKYDLAGRLSRIIYTSETAANTCDDSVSAAWNPLIRSFVPVGSAEFGIPAGHWRETVSTGNAVKVTYYDAMWRPLLSQEYDSADEVRNQTFRQDDL